MAKRDELVRAYVEALEIRPLIVLSVPGGQPSKISPSPEKKLQQVDALWFAKPQHAELVHAHAMRDLESIGALRPHGWIDLQGREVRDTLANVAAYLGASFRSMAEVQRDAGAAVERVLVSVENARKSGALAQVNASYKAYRTAQLARNEPAIPYSAHLAKFTLGL